MYAMVGEDPPKHGGKWWVFAALDHTLHRVPPEVTQGHLVTDRPLRPGLGGMPTTVILIGVLLLVKRLVAGDECVRI
jgi:hypothetical protein